MGFLSFIGLLVFLCIIGVRTLAGLALKGGSGCSERRYISCLVPLTLIVVLLLSTAVLDYPWMGNTVAHFDGDSKKIRSTSKYVGFCPWGCSIYPKDFDMRGYTFWQRSDGLDRVEYKLNVQVVDPRMFFMHGMGVVTTHPFQRNASARDNTTRAKDFIEDRISVALKDMREAFKEQSGHPKGLHDLNIVELILELRKGVAGKLNNELAYYGMRAKLVYAKSDETW